MIRTWAAATVLSALLVGCSSPVERAPDLDPDGSRSTHLASAVVVYEDDVLESLLSSTEMRSLEAVCERLVERLYPPLAVHGLVLRNDPTRLGEVSGHAPDPDRTFLDGTRWSHPRGVTSDLLELTDQERVELAEGLPIRDDEAWAGARLTLWSTRSQLRANLELLVIGRGARPLLRGEGRGSVDLGSRVELPVPRELMLAAMDDAVRDLGKREVVPLD